MRQHSLSTGLDQVFIFDPAAAPESWAIRPARTGTRPAYPHGYPHQVDSQPALDQVDSTRPPATTSQPNSHPPQPAPDTSPATQPPASTSPASQPHPTQVGQADRRQVRGELVRWGDADRHQVDQVDRAGAMRTGGPHAPDSQRTGGTGGTRAEQAQARAGNRRTGAHGTHAQARATTRAHAPDPPMCQQSPYTHSPLGWVCCCGQLGVWTVGDPSLRGVAVAGVCSRVVAVVVSECFPGARFRPRGLLFGSTCVSCLCGRVPTPRFRGFLDQRSLFTPSPRVTCVW